LDINTSYEISKEQYNEVLSRFKGAVFFRTKDSKYFIKVNRKRYLSAIEKILKKVPQQLCKTI